jgi:hypothetical protein
VVLRNCERTFSIVAKLRCHDRTAGKFARNRDGSHQRLVVEHWP